MGFTIRPATLPSDRGAMLDVLETVNMHRVPSPEMDDFDVGEWYVAESEGRVVGVAGFRLVGSGDAPVGKTTLLAVAPDQRERGMDGRSRSCGWG
jgi:N-acetylglutamate synthase-like GNAT family acetyltransferase